MSVADRGLVEVRMPTYRRPDWLRHALGTLLAQDYPNWQALVFDDSPGREAEAVVREANDPRVHYRPNAKNLGASGNLNQAFQTRPYLGGRYACVLEDDNWLLPGYLADNVQALADSGLQVLHRNQEIWSRYQDPPVPTGKTTLGNWYVPGVLTPMQLHAYSLLYPGCSNGALFWDTSADSQLYVPDIVLDATLQEYCRCQQIVEPSLFVPECRAVYADVPVNQSRRPIYGGRVHNRFVAAVWRQIIAKYGPAVVAEAHRIAERTSRLWNAERNAAFVFHFSQPRRVLTFGGWLNVILRGLASLVLLRNPIPDYHIPREDVSPS